MQQDIITRTITEYVRRIRQYILVVKLSIVHKRIKKRTEEILRESELHIEHIKEMEKMVEDVLNTFRCETSERIANGNKNH